MKTPCASAEGLGREARAMGSTATAKLAKPRPKERGSAKLLLGDGAPGSPWLAIRVFREFVD